MRIEKRTELVRYNTDHFDAATAFRLACSVAPLVAFSSRWEYLGGSRTLTRSLVFPSPTAVTVAEAGLS
jgi:hypothetical protein